MVWQFNRNKKACPPGIAKRFNDQHQRQQLFQDWMYNGHDTTKLDVLYTRIIMYRRVPFANL